MTRTRPPRLTATRLTVLCLLAAGSTGASAAPRTYDLLITGATIVDGTGAPRRAGDVLVDKGRIVRVGAVAPRSVRARRTIAAQGRVLSPGFIDMHTHGDPLTDDFEGYLAMGATTVALGQDGESAGGDNIDESKGQVIPRLAEWMQAVEAKGTKINVIALSGHGTLRHQAGISDATRVPAPAQQARMNALLAEDLRAGGFGLSTGLEYVPGRYAATEELASLSRVIAATDTIIISHMRSEDDDQIEPAIEELIAYGGKARVQVSHMKVVYGKGAARGRELLAFLARKRAEGVRLSADIYPYNAGYTTVGLLFPEWALPPNDYARVVATRREELLAHLRMRMTRRNGPGALLFGSPPYAGKTLAQLAAEHGKPYEEVLLAIGPTGAGGAHFVMDEALQDVLFTSPLTAVSTDGAPGMRHPRSTGTYAKLIENYVVGRKLLTLEEAVRKATSLPASYFQLKDIGVIRPGARADLLLFAPERVHERASFVDPFPYAEGFDVVIVNGQIAREEGKPGAIAGRLIRRPRK